MKVNDYSKFTKVFKHNVDNFAHIPSITTYMNQLATFIALRCTNLKHKRQDFIFSHGSFPQKKK